MSRFTVMCNVNWRDEFFVVVGGVDVNVDAAYDTAPGTIPQTLRRLTALEKLWVGKRGHPACARREGVSVLLGLRRLFTFLFFYLSCLLWTYRNMQHAVERQRFVRDNPCCCAGTPHQVGGTGKHADAYAF